MTTIRWEPQAEKDFAALPFTAKVACNIVIARLKSDPTNVGRSTGGDFSERAVTFYAGRGIVFYYDSFKGLVIIRQIGFL